MNICQLLSSDCQEARKCKTVIKYFVNGTERARHTKQIAETRNKYKILNGNTRITERKYLGDQESDGRIIQNWLLHENRSSHVETSPEILHINSTVFVGRIHLLSSSCLSVRMQKLDNSETDSEIWGKWVYYNLTTRYSFS